MTATGHLQTSATNRQFAQDRALTRRLGARQAPAHPGGCSCAWGSKSAPCRPRFRGWWYAIDAKAGRRGMSELLQKHPSLATFSPCSDALRAHAARAIVTAGDLSTGFLRASIRIRTPRPAGVGVPIPATMRASRAALRRSRCRSPAPGTPPWPATSGGPVVAAARPL